jgi:hypothetical protein
MPEGMLQDFKKLNDRTRVQNLKGSILVTLFLAVAFYQQ